VSELEPRPVRESASEYAELAMPNDANPLGTLFGGKVMQLVDLCGSLAAARHARRPVVTASIDHMDFRCAVHIGQVLVLQSSVNRVFRTSMEVGVRVCVEDLRTGEVQQTSAAFLTFVALGEDGRPAEIPPVIPETADEQRRFRQAGERRQYRLAMRGRERAI
jgi:acyl-CoA hydrolase